MRMNQYRTMPPQHALVGPRVPGEHLPEDEGQPPSGDVLQRQRLGTLRARSEAPSPEIDGPVPAQPLRLKGDERLGEPEEVVAENRDFADVFHRYEAGRRAVPSGHNATTSGPPAAASRRRRRCLRSS